MPKGPGRKPERKLKGCVRMDLLCVVFKHVNECVSWVRQEGALSKGIRNGPHLSLTPLYVWTGDQ